MTQYGAPFDGVLLGDAALAPYSAAEWARIWKLQFGAGVSFPNYGVFAGSGGGSFSPLEVRAQSSPSSNVDVQVGAAQIDGRFYETTAVVTLAINSNSSGNPRIDTVILRLDYTAQTVRLAVKQGTPAASPVRPTLEQDALFWEIPLADVSVANGFATLAQTTIVQRQRTIGTQSMGWQENAYAQNFNSGMAFSANLVLTPAQTVLTPITLIGNMLLDRISVMQLNASLLAFTFGWDLYAQDVNDGNTTENTIRRVAQSNGSLNGVSSGGSVEVLGALGPHPLTPGIYWLAIQNRHATNNLTLGVTAGGPLEVFAANVRRKVTTNPNGATLDAVTGWSADNFVLGVRLQGRVFGRTTVN